MQDSLCLLYIEARVEIAQKSHSGKNREESVLSSNAFFETPHAGEGINRANDGRQRRRTPFLVHSSIISAGQ